MNNFQFNPITGQLDMTGLTEDKLKQIINAITAPMVFAGTVIMVPDPDGAEFDRLALHTVNNELDFGDVTIVPDETLLIDIKVSPGMVFVAYQSGTAELGHLNAGDQILICSPTVDSHLDAVVLNNIVPLGYQFMGVADPTTQDTIVDVNVKCAWIASQAGTYTGLGNVVVDDNEIAIITRTPSGGVGIFAKTSLGKYTKTAQLEYLECSTAAGTAAKTVINTDFILSTAINLKIKFSNKNTAASSVTLAIGSTTAKPLYYNGAAVSDTNTWEAGEVCDVYYDGTNYYANPVEQQFKTGEKLNNVSIVNDLTTGGEEDVLSAEQGKVLKDHVDQLDQQVIYDVSANNAGATFDSLSALLSSENLSTLIPVAVRCGGMSIRFKQSSDNKYVQYRYMGTATTGSPNPFLDTVNWQGVDREIIQGSLNLVEGDAVYKELHGNRPTTEVLDVSSTQYTNYYFNKPIPAGATITGITGVEAYLLRADGTYNTTTINNLQLPYTTAEEYVGLKANGTRQDSITWIVGEETSGIDGQIEQLSDEIDVLEQEIQGLEPDKDVRTDISSSYTFSQFAYINSSTGSMSPQQESDGRKVVGYHVYPGDKLHISAILTSANPIFTFAAFFQGQATPTTDSVSTVLTAYTNVDKTVVDYDYNVLNEGWFLICFASTTMERRLDGHDWRVYSYAEQMQDRPICNIPTKITAVVGDCIQVFTRSCTNAINDKVIDNRFKCNKGSAYPRCWQLTPVAGDVGTHTLKQTIRNLSGQVLSEKECQLTIKGAPSSPASMKRIMVFGDSLTQDGRWVTEVARRLLSNDAAEDTMPAGNGLSNLKFIGGMGSGDAKYFGVGGWSWQSYTRAGQAAFRFQVTGVTNIVKGTVYTNNGHSYTVEENNTINGSGNVLCTTSSADNTPSTAPGTLTKSGSGSGDATISYTSFAPDVANPIWDANEEKVSYQKYLTNIGEDSVDCVVFLLGWNTIFLDFSTYENDIRTLIDTLHTEYPSAKVKLLGLQFPSLNGGLGANYGASDDWSDKQKVIESVIVYNGKLEELANEVGYSSFVEYVDIASQFDSENNMPSAQAQVNTRNAETEIRGTNGVHPAPSGYYQIADVVYRNIVLNYC